MRLDRLGLVRYGRFTDHALDFGTRPANGPDLHVVYGPNEAGKSTLLSAWLDLLYGIGLQSPYGFLHPYATMRIEGTLELEGTPRRFARIKRAQPNLLDDAGQPLADAAILSELGGIGRDGYRTMFSLDDETLEKGGEDILESRGDLGQLLFSASAGLAALGQRLDRVRQEADGFHRPRAHRTGLSELKAELTRLKDEREAIDTFASDHARLVEAEAAADKTYREAIAARGAVEARLETIGRLLGALPLLARLRAAREARSPLADLPEPPADWTARLPELQRAEVTLATRQAALAEAAGRLAAERDGIVVDAAALALAERADALAEPAARHVTAEKDLPERRLQRAEAERLIAGLTAAVGRPGEPVPRLLLIGAAEAARLADLIETRSGIEARLAAARAERAAAAERLADTEAGVSSFAGLSSPSGDALARLHATLAATKADDPFGRAARAGSEATRAAAGLAEALAALSPWSGDADALARAILPGPAEIERRRAELAEADGIVRLHAGDAARLATEIARQDAEIGALRAQAGPSAAAEASAARMARDAAWTLHRHALDAATADAFETAMRRDDSIAAARLAAIGGEARLAELAAKRAVTAAEADRAAALLDAARDRLDDLRASLATTCDGVAPGLFAAAGLDGFAEWLRRRERALELQRIAKDAAAAGGEASEAAARAAARLAEALRAAGADAEDGAAPATLIATAEAAIETAASRAAGRATLDERLRERDARAAALRNAEALDAAWQEDWRAALAATWLGGETALSTRAVRDILAALHALGRESERAASLADRIGKMEKDQEAYRAELAALAGALGEPHADEVASLAGRIRRRVETARAADARHADLGRRLAENAGMTEALAAEIAQLSRQTTAMTGFFGVATLAELGDRLADAARRRQLDAEIGEAGSGILTALGVAALAEAEALLDAADRAALAVERAEAERQREDLDLRCQQLFADRSRAADALAAVGGDGAAAAIEARRRTVLVEIEEGALRHLRLRAGIVATETALRLYRERHRSRMLARASDAFRLISRGAYSGLAAEAEKDGEMLIALSAGGGSKAAPELSKGTRFQLYLALRVAGYHEFAETRRSVPFIADDIMESFDDFRAEEAFRLFAGMAGIGQVIYLTHHRHLLPIAESVCPGVRIHRLDA